MQSRVRAFLAADWLSRYGAHIVLAMMIVVSIGLNLAWLHSDTLLGPEPDSKTYFINTSKFIIAMFNGGLGQLPKALARLSIGGRAPLYQLLSVPFLVLFGRRSMDYAVLVNVPFQILLALSTYKIGTMVFNRQAGLLGAFLVLVYPPLVQLQHIFRPNFAMAACVALCIWRLLVVLKHRTVGSVWALALSVMFGILIHPFVVFAVAVPLLVFSIYIIFFQAEPHYPQSWRDINWLVGKMKAPVFLLGFLPALVVALIPILAWYLGTGVPLLSLFETLNSPALVAFRGYSVYTMGLPLEGISYFWWYAVRMPNAVTYVLAFLLLVGVLYSLISRKLYVLSLLVGFVGAYVLLAMQSTMTWMHFAEVLPLVAVLSVGWIGSLPQKWMRLAVISVVLVTGIFVYSAVMQGFASHPWEVSIARALGSPLTPDGRCLTSDQVFCQHPPVQQDWRTPTDRLLQVLARDPGCRPGQCTLLVADRSVNFSSLTFSYYALADYPKVPVTTLSPGSIAFTMYSFNFRAVLESPYIVYVNASVIGKPNGYALALTQLLHSPPASFSNAHTVLETVRLPNGEEARLIKRTGPVTWQEAEDVVRAVDVDEKYKAQQYEILAPLYLAGCQYDKALAAYQQALSLSSNRDAEFYFGLASAYSALGQDKNAAAQYRRVVAMAPSTDFGRQAQQWLSEH